MGTDEINDELMFNITRERIREIEEKALRKLRPNGSAHKTDESNKLSEEEIALLKP